MTTYEKRLVELSKELKEQMQAEQEDDIDYVPHLLAAKINYICGYISALEKK